MCVCVCVCVCVTHLTYPELQHINQHFKSEKNLYKTINQLIRESKNLHLYHRVVNQWNNTSNNRYTLLCVTPADCHIHY